MTAGVGERTNRLREEQDEQREDQQKQRQYEERQREHEKNQRVRNSSVSRKLTKEERTVNLRWNGCN